MKIEELKDLEINTEDNIIPNYQQEILNAQGNQNGLERLIHNYYNDFMINLKNDIMILFMDSIHSFEFNYGSKTLHQYNLYKDTDREYPKCTININQLDQIGNVHFRDNGLINDSQLFTNMAENFTKEELLACSFRWVKLAYNITISFENGMDVLNYNDMIIQRYPLNLTYYNNSYYSYVDIQNQTNWDINDNMENIIYRMTDTDNKIHILSKYLIDPRYMLTNITKKIDNNNMKFNLSMDFTAEIQIPHTMKILSQSFVKDIIVTIGLAKEDYSQILIPDPITIVDDSIHQRNATALFFLSEKNLDIVNKNIILEMDYIDFIKDVPLSIQYQDIFIDINPNDYIIENNFIIIQGYSEFDSLFKLNLDNNLNFKNLKLTCY